MSLTVDRSAEFSLFYLYLISIFIPGSLLKDDSISNNVLRKLETTQTYNFLLELYLIKLREATQPFSIIPDSDLWFQILTCILTMKGRASSRFPMYADERKILYWIFLVGGGGMYFEVILLTIPCSPCIAFLYELLSYDS